MKNKLISFILILVLLATIPLSATYKYNPFTRKLDYYEAAGVLGATDAVYFGDAVTDTTWRIVRDGTKLSFLRRESGSYVEKGYFDATSFHSANIYVGNVRLEEEGGCLATKEFHAHGDPPVAGYFKFYQGTTPAVHKEAGHSILWVDSNDKLYLEKPDGTDVEIVFAAVAEYLQASKGTDQTNFDTGEDVIFDTVDISSGSSISLDTSTGRFTLSTGKTYRLTCGIRFEHTSAAKIGFAWYNITGSVELSEHARLDNMSSGTDYSILPVTQAIITPSVETEVTVRCVWEGDEVEDVNGGHTWAIIEVIAGNALYSDVWELSGTDIYYNSGNVGVGTTNPDGLLDLRDGSLVLSDADVTQPFTSLFPTNVYGGLFPNSGVAGGLVIDGLTDVGTATALLLRGFIGSADPTDTTAAVAFRSGKFDGGTNIAALGNLETAYQFSNYNNSTKYLTILGNGNVGIGEINPTEKLEVKGSILLADDAGAILTLGRLDNINEGGQINFTAPDAYDNWIVDSYQNTLRMWTNSANADYVRLSNDGSGTTGLIVGGKLGIAESSPDQELHITAAGATIKLENGDGGNYGHVKIGSSWLTIEVDPTQGTNDSALMFKGDGNEIMRINGWDGYINIPGVYAETDASAANIFVASDGSLRRSTSSRKIKKDIVENVDPNWALQFKPVTFKAKADDSEHMGFIAEDMRDVDSRLATDGDLPGLELNAIIAALTATVQEQQRQIEEIKAKIW